MKCFVWSVALYGGGNMDITTKWRQANRIIWNVNVKKNETCEVGRRNKKWSCVKECVKKKWCLTDQEEEKELVGSLAEKKLLTEGWIGRNGERKKISRQKKISDDIWH